MTILFVALIGLTLWIAWALDKLEKRKPARRSEQPVPSAPVSEPK